MTTTMLALYLVAGIMAGVLLAMVIFLYVITVDRSKGKTTTINVGHSHNIAKGQRVTIAGKPYKVVGVTDTSITIEEV